MLRLCFTNSCTFQYVHTGYLGSLQKTSGWNETVFCCCCCCFCFVLFFVVVFFFGVFYQSYFLDFENDTIRKKTSHFRLSSVKICFKRFDSISFSWCCTAPLFIKKAPSITNALSMTAGGPLRDSSSTLPLPSRKRLCHLRIDSWFFSVSLRYEWNNRRAHFCMAGVAQHSIHIIIYIKGWHFTIRLRGRHT